MSLFRTEESVLATETRTCKMDLVFKTIPSFHISGYANIIIIN